MPKNKKSPKPQAHPSIPPESPPDHPHAASSPSPAVVATPPKPAKSTLGRPALYPTPELMQAKIEEYFNTCDAGKEEAWLDKRKEYHKEHVPIPYSIEGLALFLGFASPVSLTNYNQKKVGNGDGKEQDNEDGRAKLTFSTIISRARQRVYQSWFLGGLKGNYDPRIVGLGLMTHAGYSTKGTLDVSDTTPIALRSPEETAVLKSFGERWAEAQAQAAREAPIPVEAGKIEDK